ncbi:MULTISPECIES: hypothetical protein [unclassified Variovorax]|uniref:hypothetical protein n=1 Tax=unclassified Variovorax TaxID=663243 RepID=UPI002575E7B3|nr:MULTISPECIES: hypothetical protein [unclassified Variovorax]MDM0086199.1 hypothetical protein [Variovorax sp. J22G40]MDM0145544.1 hypothetical protein [Variovorax sp. J2P1-31]
MRSIVQLLPVLLIASTSFASWAAPNGILQAGGATRSEMRRAVESHRASQREEMQREEAAAGRRLTPSELAELRSQVRQQWAPRYDAPRAVEPVVSDPSVPLGNSRQLTLPRSQRP